MTIAIEFVDALFNYIRIVDPLSMIRELNSSFQNINDHSLKCIFDLISRIVEKAENLTYESLNSDERIELRSFYQKLVSLF